MIYDGLAKNGLVIRLSPAGAEFSSPERELRERDVYLFEPRRGDVKTLRKID